MRHERLIYGAICLLVPALSGVQAQESFNAAGGNASGGGGSVSYSVGQVTYLTHGGTNGTIAEGVQRAYEIAAVTGIEEPRDLNLSFSIFPNPTTHDLKLNIIESFNANQDLSLMSYMILDMNGRVMKKGELTGYQTRIITSNLIPATYFVKVIHENKVIKSFKIIKK